MKDLSSLLDMTIDQMAGDWCEFGWCCPDRVLCADATIVAASSVQEGRFFRLGLDEASISQPQVPQA
ncbi:hypothetical protein NKI51_23360 [Mesorhizobium australicum]|uniref:hypothetical protein n=1 Tax=Mesorhizobium australicum TaxID=536018 RepID=UPI0033377876